MLKVSKQQYNKICKILIYNLMKLNQEALYIAYGCKNTKQMRDVKRRQDIKFQLTVLSMFILNGRQNVSWR